MSPARPTGPGRARSIAAALLAFALLSACGTPLVTPPEPAGTPPSTSPGTSSGTSNTRPPAGGPAGSGPAQADDDPLLLPVPTTAVWVGRVLWIADGDTLTVEVIDGAAVGLAAGDEARVRLLRIDTPEVGRDGRPDECYAQQATEILAALAPPGHVLTLQPDVELTDQYGRQLAHLWNDAGRWINGELLDRGAAEVATYRPNVAHDDRVHALQDEARDAARGRWGACPLED